MSTLFAGLDWASRTHAVCVIDDHGTVRAQFEVTHDAAGLSELRRRLAAFGEVAVAIERPSGLVVDALWRRASRSCRSIPTWSRPRGRATAATAARAMPRTPTCWPTCCAPTAIASSRWRPHSDEIRALRALVRGRDDLVATRVQLANQLRSLLESFWPGAAEVFADVDSPIALAFIAALPHARVGLPARPQAHGRLLRPARLQRPAQRPRTCSSGCTRPLRCTSASWRCEAKGELALSLCRAPGRVVEQIRLLTSRIEHDVGRSMTAQILMSFPRAGRICAAQILAELGSVRERFDSVERLAAEAGVTP